MNEIDQLLKKLFPICRSITGKGVRETLSILKDSVDFDIKQIASGTKCYDWVIPNEWNINDAYVEDLRGNRIIDFNKNNLHVVSYSTPIDQKISYQELKNHLYTLPDLPDAIPYRTSYYKKNWGFCVSYNEYKKLKPNKDYHVVIDSKLEPGNLTYGEAFVKGVSSIEILFSTYCCHPSLANDNLSGIILWTLLLKKLKAQKTYHSYRFIIAPETIGAIAYLSQNQEAMKKTSGGYVITCVGGPDDFNYKKTFCENHLIDKVAIESLNDLKFPYTTYPFDINGSDERQFSSPFFRIPVGSVCKSKYYEYDFYHTSKDDLNFIDAKNIIKTLQVYLLIIKKIENKHTDDFKINAVSKHENRNLDSEHIYSSTIPYCEPMLSKRDLYMEIGGQNKQKALNMQKNHFKRSYTIKDKKKISGEELDALRWILFYSDGNTTIHYISEKTGFSVKLLEKTAEKLCNENLLQKVN